MAVQLQSPEDLGLDFSETEEADYVPGEGEGEAPSFENDLEALDPPVDRSSGSGLTDKAGADIPGGKAPGADAAPAGEDELIFDAPAPIPDWQAKAQANNMEGVASEDDFRQQLQISRYVQTEFFQDPALSAAYRLINTPNVPEKDLIEFELRDKKLPFENDEDIERKLAEYFEDDEINDKGKRFAGYIKQQLDGRIAGAVDKLEKDGATFIGEQRAFETTLQTEIKGLPADLFSTAEKRELHRYIQSGQYHRDALLQDKDGKPVLKGAEEAKKILANAQKINPVYEEKRLRGLYAEARKLAADEFVKKFL